MDRNPTIIKYEMRKFRSPKEVKEVDFIVRFRSVIEGRKVDLEHSPFRRDAVLVNIFEVWFNEDFGAGYSNCRMGAAG